ncbi:MAG: putative bifunctional diguanylate cyclase/phosphodiesterase [Pseudomonadota bacterium]
MDFTDCDLLLVEPDEGRRRELAAALARKGMDRCREAINGLDALVQFKRSRPKMVIMAAEMPVKDGIDACRLMRSLPGGEMVSILLLVDQNSPRSTLLKDAYEVGASEYIYTHLSPPEVAIRALFALRTFSRIVEGERSIRRMEQAYRIAHLGAWWWDAGSGTMHFSRDLSRMMRAAVSSVHSLDHFLNLVDEAQRERASAAIARVMEDGVSRSLGFKLAETSKGERHFYMWLEREVNPVTQGVVIEALIQDVTQRVVSENRIQSLAHYDTLTGLPNRGYLHRHLPTLLGQADKTKTQLAMMVIDIDHFGRVNNALGYSAGDEMLKILSERFGKAIDGGELLPRVVDSEEQLMLLRTDADEFTLLVSSLHSADRMAGIAEHLQQLAAEPIVIDEHELNVTLSMGISVYPLDSDTAEGLQECASAATRHAKEQGRNNYQFSMESLNSSALKRLGLESDLYKAFERNEFELYYQPKVHLATGKVVGVEALVRWQHPELGLVSPDQFVSLAEDLGLIIRLGEWVLGEACRQAKIWRGDGKLLTVAVNVSPRQFSDPERLFTAVETALSESGLPGHQLELELTENTFIQDTDSNRDTVARLKKLGLHIAIDDFGTGYSSLGYLTRFPVDTLKIDKSFVSCVAGNAQNAEVVKTIVQLAHSMKLSVVAEGIAATAEESFLRDLGCEYGQGYHYAPPLPAPAFSEWLAKSREVGVAAATA